MSDTYSLEFRFPYAQSDKLIYGEILLLRFRPDECRTDGLVAVEHLGFWRATSGQRGHQSIEEVFRRKLGALPPSDQIAGEYWVYTIPKWKPNLGGIGFDIHTDEDETSFLVHPKDDAMRASGLIRSAFFLHLDNNFPGSAGCLVFPKDEWKTFYPTLHNLYLDHGIERVKLVMKAV
ncbi:hypothetical protein M0R72_10720 [Candidatus Pacearchaeota archaeon]|jgi:hypothetical protein|nr:hypothetical protein [Candidatus Pacearchaeota archaeon]